ncbi:hypothetical protein [Nocardia pseudobrasiliensis]|nr:hypothetical protein [Nocardia pseudobrasiliensis]
MSLLDGTVVTIAIPTLIGGLDASYEKVLGVAGGRLCAVRGSWGGGR